MITRQDFEAEELLDPEVKTWKNYLEPQTILNSWIAKTVLGFVATLLVILLIATVATSGSSLLPRNHEPQFDQFDILFTFGDSYTSYVRQERLEDPPYKCKTLSENGRYRYKPNWITFLTEFYNQSSLRAVDFAVGGSTVDGEITSPFAMGSSLMDMVHDFESSYGSWVETPGMPWQSDKSLFTFWFGVNDIMLQYSVDEGEELVRAPLEDIFNSYMTSLNTIYDAGARNFLILTCPPFDRSIIDISDEWHSRRMLDIITNISAFNARIYDMLYSFRANHTDSHAYVFDAHRFISSALDHPRDFPAMEGVKNTTGVCREAYDEDQPGPLDIAYERNICRTGELIQSYAWTSLHATYPVHNATAAQIVLDCFDGKGTGQFCT